MIVKVDVSNRVAHLRGSYPYEDLLPFWSYTVPSWFYIRRKWAYFDQETQELKYRWDGKVKAISDNDTVPAGLFWATKKDIEAQLGIKFKIRASLEWPGMKTENNLVSDSNWSFQNECIAKMLRASRFGGGIVLNATGTGKTKLAAMLFSRLSGHGVFIVDQVLLMKQAVSDLQKELGEEIGVVGNQEFRPRRITVATVQTLHKHHYDPDVQEWMRQIEVEVIDEIHDQINKRNFDVVSDIQPKAVYGLTATLQLKKKDVRVRAWSLAGPTIYEYPLAKGQEAGVLAGGIAIQVMFKNNVDMERLGAIAHMESAREKAQARSALYIDHISGNHRRNTVAEKIIKKARSEGRYSIATMMRVKHLQELATYLVGVPHRVIAGTYKGEHVSVKDRMIFKDKFEAGKVRVILANVVLKKGVNIPRVDCMVDLAAGSSANDPIQKYGRGIRLHREKDGLLYFDISDYDTVNRYNPYQKAAKRRAKALKGAGIKVHKFWWGIDGHEDELWAQAQKWLAKELEGYAGERSKHRQ